MADVVPSLFVPGELTLNRAQTAVLAARPDVSTLAMVALYPSLAEAETLAPAGGNPAGTIHVIMVFLGDVANIDMKAAARAVGSVSGSTAPLSGKVGGVGMFAAGDNGYPQLAIPNVIGLAKLRADLVAALADENIVSPSEYDWVPHISLAYVDEPSLPDLSVIGLPLTFDQLSLVEDDVRKDFPFDPQGSSDDVHRGSLAANPDAPILIRMSEKDLDGFKAVPVFNYSRSQQRRRDILINRAKKEIA